ncbi:MAG: HD domain-containing protein [Candidatus Hydrogenedens sp.]|nr:HD domain-containing protein [Candidatus Hydrogenedens sp.]
MTYSVRVAAAFALALELHDGQIRKGTKVPYVTHVMAVAAMVGEAGGSEEAVIAALLHDAAEDQGGEMTLARIRAAFGDTVADYVLACSDSITPSESDKAPWRERKEAHIAKAAALDPAVKLILTADKLHNARSVLTAHRECGVEVWKRFKGGRDGTLWYYHAMHDALAKGWDHPLLHDLAEIIGRLDALA